MLRILLLALCFGWALPLSIAAVQTAEPDEQLKVRISWGHQSAAATPFHLRLAASDLAVRDVVALGLEPEDRLEAGAWATRAGGGDIDAIEAMLQFPQRPVAILTNLHRIWASLLDQSDPDTVRRLTQDPAYRRDSRKLTVWLDAEETQGFSATVDQLLQHRAFWVPALDVYITAGERFVPFAEHQQLLEPFKGKRILDQVERAPDATYEQFTRRWEDMGHPAYQNSDQIGPGHLVGVTWDSAIPKFGIDRGGGVWNDYGNPDRFHLWFDFGRLSRKLPQTWNQQSLAQGLPVITTVFERDGLRYEVEQFAYPLNGPPGERKGDIPMVLLEKLTVRNPGDQQAAVEIKLHQRRLLPDGAELKAGSESNVFLLEASEGVLLAIAGGGEIDFRQVTEPKTANPEQTGKRWQRAELGMSLHVPARSSREWIVMLPSPILSRTAAARLVALDYPAARQTTLKFWSDYLDRGALFDVPEPAVNELFRANLWHALRLPRRHGGEGAEVKIDLPYSNFAYDQRGTPWPVNQAIYVDYMLYDLRGYHAISAEELRAIYRNNQEASGHVGGYANWGVYTPAMIYSAAQNFLLSGDPALFESLLPQTLNALDWCLAEIERGGKRPGPSRGLVGAPLNDLTGEGVWAFNQAYLFAGIDLLGKALARIEHPRAQECFATAASFRMAVGRAFGSATARSPLVQLRDQTWTPYVPCEVTTPQRLLHQWYPTDVDTGATHLLRLKALPSVGLLGDSLLHDHEDNLYLLGWGMANEPVYNQQASAYLFRDQPKAVIRAFYSMMACAFSHSVFEPVEHRWSWGQYFGPPSTDGAWFELYRRMLIHELDDDTLFLLQATPRKWLEDGQRIRVERAPTHFGTLSFTIESKAVAGQLIAEIELPDRAPLNTLKLRLRHPGSQPIRSVTLNGRSWPDFDPATESVRIPRPDQRHYSVIAHY